MVRRLAAALHTRTRATQFVAPACCAGCSELLLSMRRSGVISWDVCAHLVLR